VTVPDSPDPAASGATRPPASPETLRRLAAVAEEVGADQAAEAAPLGQRLAEGRSFAA